MQEEIPTEVRLTCRPRELFPSFSVGRRVLTLPEKATKADGLGELS